MNYSNAKQKPDLDTYQNALLSKYLNEIKSSYGSTNQNVNLSPYEKKLFVTNNNIRRRSSSSLSQRRSYNINDDVISEPSIVNTKSFKKKSLYSRPASSSSYQTGLKSHCPIYKRLNRGINVIALKNGNCDHYVRVGAPNLITLLEVCTDKLGLSSAARRLFNEDGSEIFLEEDILYNRLVFVSMGEPFKDTYSDHQKNVELSKNLNWTINGIAFNEDVQEKSSFKTFISNRTLELSKNKKIRILIFQNGEGTQSTEVVADLNQLQSFLDDSTNKLELSTLAKSAFDWDGNNILDLSNVPLLDTCLQSSNSKVYGPLWISRGERFSPNGVLTFLNSLIVATKSKVKISKTHKNQIQLAMNEAFKDEIVQVSLLSKSSAELRLELNHVTAILREFENALSRLMQQANKLKEDASKETEMGSTFTQQHISEYNMDHKLIGKKGLRLKIFENGRQEGEVKIHFNVQHAQKSLDKTLPINPQLIALLLEECSKVKSFISKKKNPSLSCLAKILFDEDGKEVTSLDDLVYDQKLWVSFGEPWKSPNSWTLEVQIFKVHAFNLLDEEEEIKNIRVFKSNLVPDDYKLLSDLNGKWKIMNYLPENTLKTDIKSQIELEERYSSIIQNSEIGQDNMYMFNTEKDKLILYGELALGNKIKKEKTWPLESQIWIITKAGYIFSKSIKSVLSLSSRNIVKTYEGKAGEFKAEGKIVTLQKRENISSHKWRFTADGFISSQEEPNLVLTLVQNVLSDDVEKSTNGESFCLAALPVFTQRQYLGLQRWGLKQEKFGTLGQWRLTDVENGVEWHKLALSWPIRKDGTLNESEGSLKGYDWPMEGYLQPYAPPVSYQKKTKTANLRLKVLEVGSEDISKNIIITLPNLPKVSEKTDANDKLLFALKTYYNKILEESTLQLKLTSHARRIFNCQGNELTPNDLLNLTHDELVYVSCGEAMMHHNSMGNDKLIKISIIEQDLKKIMWFNRIRSVKNLVLEVSGKIRPESLIFIGQLQPHETESDKQRFLIKKDFITLSSNENFVLSFDAENKKQILQLSKKSSDDVAQRWVYDEDNGYICPKYCPEKVLSIDLSTCKTEYPCTNITPFIGYSVILQKKIEGQMGVALQKFSFENQLIKPFISEAMDIEVTAAVVAGICTGFVVGDQEIAQMGYEIKSREGEVKNKKFILCSSCARVNSSKYKLSRIINGLPFSCSMIKNQNQTMQTTLPYLKGKINFAVGSLEADILRIEEELDVAKKDYKKSLKSRRSAMSNDLSNGHRKVVKLLVKDDTSGDTNSKVERVIGSDLTEILDECTKRFNMPQAARHLFTKNGVKILHMTDLFDLWAELKSIKESNENAIECFVSYKDNFSKKDKETNFTNQSNIYEQPKVKRVLGLSPISKQCNARYICGCNMADLLINATARLDLPASANYIFDTNGIRVKNFEFLEKDKYYIFSSTKKNVASRKDFNGTVSLVETEKIKTAQEKVNVSEKLTNDIPQSTNTDYDMAI